MSGHFNIQNYDMGIGDGELKFGDDAYCWQMEGIQ